MPSCYWLFLGPLCAWCSFGSLSQTSAVESGDRQSDAPRGLFTPRWVELRQQYGIDRPRGGRCECYFHRIHLSPQGLYPLIPWNQVVTPDMWPEEVVDDMARMYDDLRNQWSTVDGGPAGSTLPPCPRECRCSSP